MKLADYLEATSYDIAFWSVGLRNPDYPADGLGALSQELAVKLRAMAIMVLLVRGDADAFFRNLIRSALARIAYLERLSRDGIEGDHHQGAGRTRTLFDALAAGRGDLVVRQVELAPASVLTGHEYEEDFHCAQVLRQMCLPLADVSIIERELAEFESSLGNVTDPRLDVLRAIHTRDAAAFAASFDALLDARDARIADDRRRGQLEEPHVIAERLVYVDALALLRLASRSGLPCAADYRYCPSLARGEIAAPFDGD